MQPWLSHLSIRQHWLASIIISSNHNERMMALSNPNFRVVVLDDEPHKYFELINGEYNLPKGESVFSVLLPPHESIDAFINGEFENSNTIYEEYLFYNPNVQHCLNTIFTLLFHNISILIFIPQDSDPVWSVINTFINYLYSRYGIITSTIQQPLPCMDFDSVDQGQYATTIDLMYTNGTIPTAEYCLQYPIETVPMSPLAMNKICIEEGRFNPEENMDYSMQFGLNFVYGMKHNILRNISNPNSPKINIAVNMEGMINGQ